MRYYIAAPFFTTDQKRRIHAVVNMLRRLEGVDAVAYLPMDFMVLKPDDPFEKKQKVFRENLVRMEAPDGIIAILDDKDAGTTWEMGYCYGREIPVIGVYVDGTDKINVMLQMGCLALCDSLAGLQQFLTTGTPPFIRQEVQ